MGVDKEQIRTRFLTAIFEGIVKSGYSFRTKPDFRAFCHGNLKFFDEKIMYQGAGYHIVVTLEHYAIKREGWHPIYWGLQCFYEDGSAMHPEEVSFITQLSASLAQKVNRVLPGTYDPLLIESKYGWFGWVCFRFSEQTSDLDDERIYDQLQRESTRLADRLLSELFVYIEAWKSVICEIPVLIKT